MNHNYKPITILVLVLQILFFSCEETDDQTDDTVNIEKDYYEEANKISENVILKGSTKVEGAFPRPTGALTLETVGSNTGSIALLDEGFYLYLHTDSDSDVVGAYIQFAVTSELGSSTFTPATSYYKVEFKKNDRFAKNGQKTAKFNALHGKSNNLSAKYSFSVLDVDFNDKMTPGEYHYFISVYDDAGNVSAEQQVSFTILQWGGKEDLVGTWNYTRYEKHPPNGDPVVTPLGSERCVNDAFECKAGTTIENTICETVNDRTYTFKTDGTYTSSSNSSSNSVNFLLAYNDCEIEYIDTTSSVTANGKWLYHPEENAIILVEYNFTTNNGAEGPETTTIEVGDAYLYWHNNALIQNDLYSFGWPVGGDLNADGVINDDDSGYATFYQKQ